MWTCAAELRAGAILGWDVGSARSILVAGSLGALGRSRALAMISERVGSERAYGYAVTAIRGAAVVRASFDQAFPWWPGP